MSEVKFVKREDFDTLFGATPSERPEKYKGMTLTGIYLSSTYRELTFEGPGKCLCVKCIE